MKSLTERSVASTTLHSNVGVSPHWSTKCLNKSGRELLLKQYTSSGLIPWSKKL